MPRHLHTQDTEKCVCVCVYPELMSDDQSYLSSSWGEHKRLWVELSNSTQKKESEVNFVVSLEMKTSEEIAHIQIST